MADSYHADADWFNFYLCTGKTEYIFSVRPKDTDIYCGASCNFAFDIGLFSGGQYFRIRNYKENRDKYGTFWRDFSYEVKHIEIPTIQCEPGKCTRTDQDLSWDIKRYTDDEIVLQGCGDDEYIYRRLERRDERFLLCKEKSDGRPHQTILPTKANGGSVEMKALWARTGKHPTERRKRQ